MQKLNGSKFRTTSLSTFTSSATPSSVSLYLAVADEKGSIRIWELPNARLLRGITNVFAAANVSAKETSDSEIMSMCFAANNSALPLLYVAVNNQVLVYNLDHNLPVISKPDTQFLCAEDEINQIAINDLGTLLAVADDSGRVSILDSKSGKCVSKIEMMHDSVVQTKVSFQFLIFWYSRLIRFLVSKVISGSMDKDIKLWNFTNGLLDHFDCTYTPKPSATSQTTSINPPFVTAIDLHKDGNVIAAGLGDGNIILFQNHRSQAKKRDAKKRQGNGDAAGRRMLEGGFDGDNCFWKWAILGGGHNFTITSM
ncbi:WD repeat-containing protein 53 [Nowakowskiella sp. JEL0407]|nr:WD repeat-containing protein 53 [Nowakowskiella sp. JEL0407]